MEQAVTVTRNDLKHIYAAMFKKLDEKKLDEAERSADLTLNGLNSNLDCILLTDGSLSPTYKPTKLQQDFVGCAVAVLSNKQKNPEQSLRMLVAAHTISRHKKYQPIKIALKSLIEVARMIEKSLCSDLVS